MAFLLNSLGRLWLAGVKVDWSEVLRWGAAAPNPSPDLSHSNVNDSGSTRRGPENSTRCK